MTTQTRISLLGVLVVGLFYPDGPAFARQATAASNAVKTVNEAGWNRSISLDYTGIQLDELLKKLNGEGVVLRAGPSCAIRKLQLRLKRRSLNSVMQALAELLPGVWTPLPDGKGYTLEMTGAAQHRQQLWWEMVLEERERVRQARRNALLRDMRAELNLSKPGSSKDSSNAEGYALGMDTSQFFRELPSDLQERIADQLNDASANAGPHLISEEGAVVVALAGLPQGTQRLAQDALAILPEGLRPEDTVTKDAQIEFINTGDGVSASLLTTSDKTFPLYHLAAMQTAKAFPLGLDHTYLDRYIKQMGENAPDAWKRLAEYQHRRVWANELPVHTPPAVLPCPRRADELHRLSEQTDMEYIADYHSLPCRPLEMQEKTASLKYPLREELNRFAVAQDASWKRRADNLYLFRNNRWYRDDLLEVPAPLAVKWADYVLKHKTDVNALLKQVRPTPAQLKEQIEWESDILTRLNPWQIGRGLSYLALDQHTSPTERMSAPPFAGTPIAESWSKVTTWFPFALTGPRVLQDQNLIRFYQSLDAGQQAALLEAHLDYHSLSPQQQQQGCYLRPTLRAQSGQPVLLLGVDNSVMALVINAPAEPIVDWRTPLKLVISRSSQEQASGRP